jgi:chromosome segregation protein
MITERQALRRDDPDRRLPLPPCALALRLHAVTGMLKRLELVGFKSFADRTLFEFSEGVTGIVGPNGSGKSNVVDAVRWVLGEQSAKSLRGGEMADVIFNGSSSRRSLGMAEVTMTFDNRRRSLVTDADEVQIGRRVYRSGEGEYLINNQVCRLKDIKDLFLGSGAGADAYCIIEQGRVDVLLQASTKERRTIFEEAAGISRFKAKKIETLRRLERVDQNLQRLRDILDEVEKQLRSVKLQAAKAQRYQEYSARLRELRVDVGLRDFHFLTEDLRGRSEVLDRLRAALAEQTSQADAWERQVQQLDEELDRLQTAIREQETEFTSAREQIAAEETTLTREWALVADIEQELSATRQRLAAQQQHLSALGETAALAAAQWREVEAREARQRGEVEALEQTLSESETELTRLHAQVDRDKDLHFQMMRQAARLQNDVVSYKAQVDNLTREHTRLMQRSEQAAEHLASIDVELADLKDADDVLHARLTAARQAQADMRQERERLHQAREEGTQRASDLRAERSGVASRIEVLENLERSHEGLNSGAREVIALLEQSGSEPWGTVVGIVAEFLTVRREYAPLIDLVLGERAQRFLVRDPGQLALALRQRTEPFSGRVSFLQMTGTPDESPDRRRMKSAALAQNPDGAPLPPGVVALAEQVVRCDHPGLEDLPRRLLAMALIVRDLATAQAVAAAHPGCRCVTLQGELLEADGTLTVGTHHAESGILSRKSELRELREQVVALDGAIAGLEHDLGTLRERIGQLDGRIENAQLEIDVQAEQVADLRSRISLHKEKRQGLHEEVILSRSEIGNLEQEIEHLQQSWDNARKEAADAEARVQATQAGIAEGERSIRSGEERRQERQQAAMTARVALAQVEERVRALRTRHEQAEADLRRRTQELDQAEEQLKATTARLEESQRTLLRASSARATWYVRKESAERLLGGWEAERGQLRQQRQHLAEEAQAIRSAWRTQQEEAHARELEVNDLRHRRESICARLLEDYQLDLAILYQEKGPPGAAPSPSAEPPSAPLPEEEMEELRRKLSRLGSVNLEAIQELTELEARASSLQIQFDDLTAAQKALQEIIGRINSDSRRLFTETYATIRTHFQELFRKLFGGGMADIVLEDETDVLESGIEIVARPPGKELRSISLMSGGEKTLTAVALLLAIFRSKPSPFCILDEVDAALDEANIARFTGVLREFLDRSQFILITHSKRTMGCADVLYGVTMQESGISRRYAVRFEDWPDDEAPPQELAS